jgi:hypothetical protein
MMPRSQCWATWDRCARAHPMERPGVAGEGKRKAGLSPGALLHKKIQSQRRCVTAGKASVILAEVLFLPFSPSDSRSSTRKRRRKPLHRERPRTLL